MTRDEQTFDDFFRAHFGRIVAALTLIVGSTAAAEDAAQEAFVRLYARWRTVSRYESPAGWLRVVATRLAVKAARRSPAEPLAERGDGDRERSLDTRAAIAALPSRQRAAVVLHYLEDRPVAEVAEALGCKEATARVHLHKARKTLAAVLRERIDDVAG